MDIEVLSFRRNLDFEIGCTRYFHDSSLPAAVPFCNFYSRARGLPSIGAEPYIHTQSKPLSVWTIVHNRGHLADVTIYDDTNDQIIGDVHHDSDNMTTVTFSIPVAGRARVD